MRRTVLFFTIIGLCVLVLIVGNATFINSNSVLKVNKENLAGNKQNEYSIFVDITENKMYVIKKGKVIKTYPVSSGKYSSPSPIGDWKIIGKDTWGEGFGGRWMGFNVPWGKYGIHGTSEPWSIGGPASHGCIRMFNKNVAELYDIIPTGTPVKIYGGIFGAFGNGFRTIKSGDRGADVYEVQKKLKEQGYFNGYVNGIYGSETKRAIYKFEKDKKLPTTEVVGYQFYTKLGIILMD